MEVSSTESALGMSNWDNAWQRPAKPDTSPAGRALQRPAKPIGSAGELMVLAVGIWSQCPMDPMVAWETKEGEE